MFSEMLKNIDLDKICKSSTYTVELKRNKYFPLGIYRKTNLLGKVIYSLTWVGLGE